MVRRRDGQGLLGEVVLFGVLGTPETLLDPALRRVDALLGDEAMLDTVWAVLPQRRPQSARRGRPGTPAEVVLRLLVLKHLRGWSYEELEWEVWGSVAYRHFCRIGGGTVPDAKTLVCLGQLLDGRALQDVLARVVAVARERRVTRGRRLRIDTTVVEASIRRPDRQWPVRGRGSRREPCPAAPGPGGHHAAGARARRAAQCAPAGVRDRAGDAAAG